MLVRISDVLSTDSNELLYPNQKRRSGGVSRLVDDDFFGKLTVVIWIAGFLLGLPAGSQGYASGVNTLRGIPCFLTHCAAGFPHF